MKWCILFLTVLCGLPAMAQVSFQFVPEVYGRNIAGLYNCKILNTAGKRSGSLTIRVSTEEQGRVVTITTPAFDIMPGINSIPASAVRNASVQFSYSPVSRITIVQKTFPQGQYDYCFTLNFNDNTGSPAAEDCFQYILAPFAELNLISPYDKDKVCETRPLLTWQPLIPAIAGASYQLIIAEIKADQTALDALNYNTPIISQAGIAANILPYPPSARELEQGKRYVWQVTAYQGQTALNRSEVWEFTIGCDGPIKKLVPDDGYRNIEDLLKGNYYVANGSIHFALTNAYQEQPLKYTIQALNEVDKKISGLPKITLVHGENKISIDLALAGTMQDGSYYILYVTLPDGTAKSLRFLYHDEK